MSPRPSTPDVRVKRVYEPAAPDDGRRVLVDRVWPRGVSKERAALALWCKAVAPSSELRTWYQHDPAKFDEFAARYRSELVGADAAAALADLQATAGVLTLLTATTDLELSQAVVLATVLRG
jgi:uncharacterized protein YeaO (DUF488 family)